MTDARELTTALHDFADLLERERSAIEAREGDRLTGLAAEKQQIAERIAACDVSVALDADPAVRMLIEECAQKNRVNGMAINSGINRIGAALRILHAAAPAETYAADGSTSSFSRPARPLAKG